MKKILFLNLCLFLLFSPVIFADSSEYVSACEKIREGELEQAEAIADSIMKNEPKNPESYTLKSSILVSRNLQGGAFVGRNFDESVFENAAGYTGSVPNTLDKKTALESEALLLKAIAADPRWKTSYYTICYMYSISYNVDKLISMLKTIKKRFDGDDDMISQLGDYAINLYKRADIDGAVKVYESLMELWPERSAFVNDLGVLYVQTGEIEKAYSCAEKCMAMKDVDYMTAMTSASIFTLAGDYENGLKAAKMYSRLKKDDYALAYHGLYKFIKGDKTWKETIMECKKSHKDDIAFIQSLISMKDEKGFDGLDFDKADRNMSLMTLEGLSARYPENTEINLNLGYSYARQKNHSKAAGVFARLEKNAVTLEDAKVQVYFYHAWALQAQGKGAEADNYWKKIVNVPEAGVRETANYFLGKNAQKKGDKVTAKAYLEKVRSGKTTSKYAQMANDRLKNLDNKDFEYGPMMDVSDCMVMTPAE